MNTVEKKALLVIIALVLPILLSSLTSVATTSPTSIQIPPITYNVTELVAADIGPGAPVIVKPGDSFNITLIAPLNISAGYIWTVAPSGSKLVLRNYTVNVVKTGATQLTIKLPQEVQDGVYDLVLVSGGSCTSVNDALICPLPYYTIPRSVTVISGLPRVLKIVENTDLHFISGQPDPIAGDLNRFSAAVVTSFLNPHLVLWLGDVGDTAAIKEYQMAQAYRYTFYYPYPVLSIPGNHDGDGKSYSKYIGPVRWYRVLGDKLLIVGIFSTESGYPSWEDLSFLAQTLETYSSIPLKLVLVHHPPFYYQGTVVSRYDDENTLKPYAPGVSTPVSSYWSNNMTAFRIFLKLVEDYNVTAVLSGHTHRDFFVNYTSTRTGTTTYFLTFTTSAHGSASYDGIGYFEIDLETGEISFPIRTPWWNGFSSKTLRPNLALNSIPVGIYIPQNNLGWSNREYIPMRMIYSQTAYVFSMENKLDWLNLSGEIVWSLPWAGDAFNSTVNTDNGGVFQVLDHIILNGRLILYARISLPYLGKISASLHIVKDTSPPNIVIKGFSRTPTLNRTIVIYIRLSDREWGIDPFSIKVWFNDQLFNYSYAPGTITTQTNEVEISLNTVLRSTATTNATLKIQVSDNSGKVSNKTFIVTYFAPQEAPQKPVYYEYPPSEVTTTSPTETPSTTTSPATTTPPETTPPPPTTSPVTAPSPFVDMTVVAVILIVTIIILMVSIYLYRRGRH